MTQPIDEKGHRISTLTEDEAHGLLRLLDDECDLDENIEEHFDGDRPVWLGPLLERLRMEELYQVYSDGHVNCKFGLLHDSATGECWTYSTDWDEIFLCGEVPGGGAGLTPEAVWSLVKDDLDGLGNPILDLGARINPDLIRRDLLEAYLRQALLAEGRDRIGIVDGVPLDEWLDQAYGAAD